MFSLLPVCSAATFPMSYTNLVQSQLNVRLRQTQSRTDWTRRPLSDAQLHYAAEDVEYLLPLWNRIGEPDWRSRARRLAGGGEREPRRSHCTVT